MTQEAADDDAVREDGTGEVATEPDLQALKDERDELRDLLIRKQAEFENFRKRTERERGEFVQFALADCMKELLNVLDSFELALKDRRDGADAAGIHRGYELIYKQLAESLQRFGLESIDATGVAFDPNFHQAVSTQPSSEVGEGMVLADLRKGYLLKGRLLRPSMVTVAAAPEAGSGDEDGSGGNPEAS